MTGRYTSGLRLCSIMSDADREEHDALVHALDPQAAASPHSHGPAAYRILSRRFPAALGSPHLRSAPLCDERLARCASQVALPPRDIADEVLEKVGKDNKRGYLPVKEGFCPFILARRIGEMHAPNEHYLEYVDVALVREAIVAVVEWLRAGANVAP